MKTRFSATAVSACLLLGFMSVLPQPSVRAADAKAELTDNPAYQAWAGYKPGTFVTHDNVTEYTMEGAPTANKMTMTRTTKLVELTADKAVVETSSSVQTPMGKQQSPMHKMEIPAKISKEKADLPMGIPAEASVEIKDMKKGTDTIEVKGEKLETTTQEFTAVVKQGEQEITSHAKVWSTNKVPGGLVKMETNVDKPIKVSNTMNVTDYKIEK